MLSQLIHLNLDLGLFRDDGLGVSRMTARQTELAKKQMCQVFEDNGLKITVETN